MTGTLALNAAVQGHGSEIDSLLDLSAKIGRDPLLTQGSSGNVSVKLDRTLWVKASGEWLAHARQQELLVAVPIFECLSRLAAGERHALAVQSSCANRLRPSIETFMHAVLRDRVVAHVHSIHTIAWAVRQDAEQELEQRLYGLRWRWIPYTPSGALLARRVRNACRRGPKPDVFILGNHGLVVSGHDCSRVEYLISDVERRLAVPPRIVAQPNHQALEEMQRISGWRLPEDPAIHTLGTDGISRRISQAGVLFPAQAVFLGPGIPQVSRHGRPSEIKRQLARIRGSSPFFVVERSGVLLSEDISREEEAVLKGYIEVLRRIDSFASIRYLSKQELRNVLDPEATPQPVPIGRETLPLVEEPLYREPEAEAGLSGPGLR